MKNKHQSESLGMIPTCGNPCVTVKLDDDFCGQPSPNAKLAIENNRAIKKVQETLKQNGLTLNMKGQNENQKNRSKKHG